MLIISLLRRAKNDEDNGGVNYSVHNCYASRRFLLSFLSNRLIFYFSVWKIWEYIPEKTNNHNLKAQGVVQLTTSRYQIQVHR